MNPKKEIIDQFEQIKFKFDKYSDAWKSNQKLNVKSLTKKDYELILNQLMNFFNELIQNRANMPIVLQGNLDLKCWNLLTVRISLVIKYPIDPKHLGKNSQLIIQNLYSVLLNDLRNNFDFFRNVYSIIINYDQEKDLEILKSNVLTFMGDLKKLKLIFNKKFEEFKDIINIEGDTKKDANDAIRFFNYALNNNPRNTRVYSNLGYVYREFLEDHMSSAYWFIRALSCIDNEMKKIKDNLEKDFNFIRKRLQNIEYNVDPNIENISFLKYDIEYLPTLFYRIIGILFMSIDVDELSVLMDNFKLIITRILQNYQVVPDNFKINYEVNDYCAQMILLSIFSLHYSVNNLGPYDNNPQKIILNKDKPQLLSFDIYNHGLIKDLDTGENIKSIIKQSLNFIIMFTHAICENICEDNCSFIDKYLLILFYWLSLNYDVFNLIMDDNIKKHLKYLNYYFQNDPEIKKFFMPQTEVTLKLLTDKINNYILPIELTFLGNIPMHRFFELNKKRSIMRVDEIKEIMILNKLILIHFMDMFGLTPQHNEEIACKFFKRKLLNIRDTFVNPNEMMGMNVEGIKEKLNAGMITLPQNYQVKEKPLIILDASNVAMKHGESNFSCKGIQIVMDFFTRKGHHVISFLPEYLFRQKDPKANDQRKKVVPDNLDYLIDLSAKHLVIQSPPQDYDDSYCIRYAKKHNAYIITNDMFRDYLEKIVDNKKRETEKMWIKEKCISFTFNKDEFLPNPDATFFREFNIHEYEVK